MKEDFKYYKERKILKDEVQQDGKNANTSQPGIEPIYIYDKVKEDFKYYKERKILKDEVQQDGKNANTPQPGIEPGTSADTAGALPTELLGPGRNPTITSDISTDLLLPSCSI